MLQRIIQSTRKTWVMTFAIGAISVACGGGNAATKEDGYVPHTNYGGCMIQGRHYHNTNVYIGAHFEPSLTEWLKY